MTTPSQKPQFHPLLEPGFHSRSLGELARLVVDPFPLSQTRAEIFASFEECVESLREAGISAELWVDGSFLTEKIDPSDIDFVMRIDSDCYDYGTPEQKAVVEEIGNSSDVYHSHVFASYPEASPNFELGQYLYRYWLQQFGKDEHGEFKGIALVRVPWVIWQTLPKS